MQISSHRATLHRFPALLCAGALLALPMQLQAGGSLELGAASVHAGGGVVSGGEWRATVAIGQIEYVPDGVARNGTLELTGGILAPATVRPDAVFASSFEAAE